MADVDCVALLDRVDQDDDRAITGILRPRYSDSSTGWLTIRTWLKLYFADTGLLCFLQGFRRPQDVAAQALWGAVWENLVVSEVRKRVLATGHPPPLWSRRGRQPHQRTTTSIV